MICFIDQQLRQHATLSLKHKSRRETQTDGSVELFPEPLLGVGDDGGVDVADVRGGVRVVDRGRHQVAVAPPPEHQRRHFISTVIVGSTSYAST